MSIDKDFWNRIREKKNREKELSERYKIDIAELQSICTRLKMKVKSKNSKELLDLVERELMNGYDLEQIREIYNIKIER